MKRLLTLALVIWSVATEAGFPPTTLSGQASLTKPTTFNFKTPYQQSTATSTGGLIETGGANILANPGFEHSTFNTGWTCSLGSATATTNVLAIGSVYSGAQAMKVTSIGAGVRCYQSNGSTAISQVGQQMNLKLMVNSTDPLLQVCSLEGGTTSSFDFNCKTVPVTTTAKPWQTVIIPFIGNGTSNGIVFKSATTTTQNIYVDDAHVGDGLPANAGIINSTPWTTYNATVNSFGTTSPTTNFCKYRTVSTDVEVACDLASTGTMTATLASVSLPNSWTIDTSRINVANTTSASGQAVGHWVNAAAGNFGSIVTATGTSTSVVYFGSTNGGVSMLIPTNGNAIISNAALSVRFKVPVAALSGYASSAYVAENADTPYVPCSFSTLAWQGLGNVTSSLECKRDGDVLRMRGRLDIGTVTASQAQFLLPNNWGAITTKSTATANSSVGMFFRGASATTILRNAILQPSVNYFQTSGELITSATPPFIAVGGTTFSNNDAIIFPEITIPIQGWASSNLIVGSFEGVTTTPGSTLPVVFGAGSATVCSASPCTLSSRVGSSMLATGSVTRTSTGLYPVTFTRTLRTPPSCTVSISPLASANNKCTGGAVTTSGFTIQCVNGTPAVVDEAFYFNCVGEL